MKYANATTGFMLLLLTLLVLLNPAITYPHNHPRRHHPALAGRGAFALTTKYPIADKAIATSSHTKSIKSCSGGQCIGSATYGSCNTADSALIPPSGLGDYSILCDVDFLGQDIYPFVLATSFSECLEHCRDFNQQTTDLKCLAIVYAPSRLQGADNCYLKYSIDRPTPAAIPLVGAILASDGTSPTASSKSIPTPRNTDDSLTSDLSVAEFQVLGTSTNIPPKQYVNHAPYEKPQKLYDDSSLLSVDESLVRDYPLAEDTGSWTESKLSNPQLADMKSVPHLSRDGGRGGTINGTQIFVFCDTQSVRIDNTSESGQLVSFVSSSVATDSGMHALIGEPLQLVDGLGEWQDDVGRMRGFAPMTTGEESFNTDISGQGYRYAIWPESSLIPLNASHSLLYPTLVYDIDLQMQAPVFNEIGNSLLLVSVDPTYGPVADRIVKQLYKQGEVAFGTLGGIRAWGSEGSGANDGRVYLFGQHNARDGAGGGAGVLVARTTPSGVSDLSTYTYWDGKSWTSTMPSCDSDAVILDLTVRDLDIFYVPSLRSFVMVYLNIYGDNTFYYRHLPLDLAIDPTGDYVEHIISSEWSEEKVLARLEAPEREFIYAGGVHAGYFASEDITNGGWKMLLTWTEKVGPDPSSPDAGYAHKSAYIRFSLD